MDKVKKFLEAYVEWLALLLGVGFLGWMLYSYVLLKPVSVAVGPNPAASPAEVDHLVWDGPGHALKGAIDNQAPPPPMAPQVEWPAQVAETFNQHSSAIVAVTPVPWIPIAPPLDADNGTVVRKDNPNKKIQKLPDAPALGSLAVSGGHSNVPGAIALAPGGAPPPANAPVTAVDKNWRTIAGTLHTADLAKSFADAGIVPGSAFSDTTILRVVLIRQERNVDGSWPNDDQGTEIAPLDINPLPKLPPIDANFADQKDYSEGFAQKNVAQIVQPAFYQVLQGDKWYEPGTQDPNQIDEGDDNVFDPLNPLTYTGDPTKLLPNEKKAYDDAKAKQAARDAAKAKSQNGRNAPPVQNLLPSDNQTPGDNIGGGNGGGNGGGGKKGRSRGLAIDPQRDRSGGELPPPPQPDMMPPPGYQPQPGQPQPGQPSSGGTLPAGSFDPSQQADIRMWAHDATVVAGKTYRYKLQYIISNPVARSNGLCANPAMARQFYIVSKPSAWTDPISVESDTNFYAVEEKHGIHFDIFKWKNGVWQMQSVQVNPGDMVGSADANGTKTDFTTGWTLVDIRSEGNAGDRTLILVSDNGTVLTKELSTDQHSSGYRRLYQLANGNKEKTAAANGTPPPPIN